MIDILNGSWTAFALILALWPIPSIEV